MEDPFYRPPAYLSSEKQALWFVFEYIEFFRIDRLDQDAPLD